ncbi:MAG: hypothetical protein WCT18_03460, partial [Patescibacteria group bacterium]
DNNNFQEDNPDSEKDDSAAKKKLGEEYDELINIIKNAESFQSLQEGLVVSCAKNIQKKLPNEKINLEVIQAVTEAWDGNLEPVFTYVARYPRLNRYVAEMFPAMVTQESWQNWRYDLNNEKVQEQVGFLTDEKLSAWKKNMAAEMGEIMIKEESFDQANKIKEIISTAIFNNQHIAGPESGNKNALIQEVLSRTLNLIKAQPNIEKEIIESEKARLRLEMEKLDQIIGYNNALRMNDLLSTSLARGVKISFNAKSEKLFKDLGDYLSLSQREELFYRYKKFSESVEKKPVPIEDIFDSTMRETVQENIAKKVVTALALREDKSFFVQYGLDSENFANVGPYFNKRQELTATADLLDLAKISQSLIYRGKLRESGGKNSEELNDAIKNLKKFFKGSPFLQDLENIEFQLAQKKEFGGNKRLAVFSTDDPQFVWQVGKYPLGCGSCQNYSAGSMAYALMGYVGDAHSRAVYLFDINKLPKEYQEIVEEQGVAAVLEKKIIPPNVVLNAVLARTIIKLTSNEAIYIEPTYTSVNKSDNSLDNHINSFVKMAYGDSMQIPLAKGIGTDVFKMPSSRNPSGQYEDATSGGADNAGMGVLSGAYIIESKLLNKSLKLSGEELAVMEKMRQSMNG